MGGAALANSGYALTGIVRGQVDLGNGVGMALSHTQRIGAAAGLVGTEYAAITSAIHSFAQGSARGDLSGISSIATAIAPFTGPAAPFIEMGAAVMSLIGSLFGDPRQERINAIQETLMKARYVQPAPHHYSYGVGGGGTDFSDTGAMRSGAQEQAGQVGYAAPGGGTTTTLGS